MAFLNCRPSVIAAALLYVERRSRGIIPFWPSMLAKLTGYQVCVCVVCVCVVALVCACACWRGRRR